MIRWLIGGLIRGLTRGLRSLLASLTSMFARNVAAITRCARIAMLVASVYSLGRQQGVMEGSRAPTTHQQRLMDDVLSSLGITHWSTAERMVQHLPQFEYDRQLREWRTDHSPVADAGHRILDAARELIRQKRLLAVVDAYWTWTAYLFSFLPDMEYWYVHNLDPTVRLWKHAHEWFTGDEAARYLWEYVVVRNPTTPQRVIVVDGLPRRFVVTTSELTATTSPDELAFVLGRELSHAMLGHEAAVHRVEAILRGAEIGLLFFMPALFPPLPLLLPSLPLTSLAAVMTGLRHLRQLAVAQLHQHQARQADALGRELAAMVRHDPAKAPQVPPRRAATDFPDDPLRDFGEPIVWRAKFDPQPSDMARLIRQKLLRALEDEMKRIEEQMSRELAVIDERAWQRGQVCHECAAAW